jgi:hypothetical protein
MSSKACMPLQFHASEIRHYYSSIWNHTVLYISGNIRPARGRMCSYKFSIWPETPLVVPLSSSQERPMAHRFPPFLVLIHLLFPLSCSITSFHGEQVAVELAGMLWRLRHLSSHWCPRPPSPPFWHSSSPLSASSTTATVAAVFFVSLCSTFIYYVDHGDMRGKCYAMTCFTTSTPLRSWLGKINLSAVVTPLMGWSLLRSLGCWWQ